MTKQKEYPWSWLRGPVDNQFDLIIHLARHYFSDFNEDEVRECWCEFESILNWYVNEIGNKFYYRKNPLTIIYGNLDLLQSVESFPVFINKWAPKFQKIHHPVKSDIAISWKSILGSLFILHKFSIGDMYAAKDMGELLSAKQLDELEFSFAEKKGVKENARRAAETDRRQALSRLIDKILLEEPKARGRSNSPIIYRFKNQTKSDREICPIDFVITSKHGGVSYTAINGIDIIEKDWEAVKKIISARKKQFKEKNKSP